MYSTTAVCAGSFGSVLITAVLRQIMIYYNCREHQPRSGALFSPALHHKYVTLSIRMSRLRHFNSIAAPI